MKHFLAILASLIVISSPISLNEHDYKKISVSCMRYIRNVIRESRLHNLDDYSDIFMGQIEQESECNEKITSFDHGMGLAQFMPGTAKWIHEKFNKELSEISFNPNPYNPKWAIRAIILYDKFLLDKVECKNDWHFALRAYNGGLLNINKEIKLANSCDYDEVAMACARSKFSCKVNISYPYMVFKRSLKYILYLKDDFSFCSTCANALGDIPYFNLVWNYFYF
ncbi:MAG: transglycosylase SLT domain-containing protein, partial [candidate division WOR-3 bacterium]